MFLHTPSENVEQSKCETYFSKPYEYIKPLDGLRAIAILAVLVFHLDKTYLPGGFVGVDIFFTISGFIISRNLFESLAKNNFSLLRFYHKRINRLVPSVIVTVIFTLLCIHFILSQDIAARFSQTGFLSIISIANFYFWRHSGYFDDDVQSNVFLHTWSLGVEEQFYLIWPILIVLFWRFPPKTPLLLTVTFLISLAFAIILSFYDQPSAFYLMPARIFQFSIGAVIAWTSRPKEEIGPIKYLQYRRFSNILFLLGLAAICYSAIMAEGQNYNFFIAAMLPTIGTTAILVSINSTFSNLLLGSGIMRFIGLRAYSLYLVHWPIITISVFLLGNGKTFQTSLLLILQCFFFAELLHQLVEKPLRLRSRNENVTIERTKSILVLILFILGISLTLLYWSKNIKSIIDHENMTSQVGQEYSGLSYSEQAEILFQVRNSMGRVNIGCQLPLKEDYSKFNEQACMANQDNSSKILVIGDSFVAESLIILEQLLKKEQLISAATSGYLPVYPQPKISNSGSGTEKLNKLRFEWAKRDDIKAIIITSNWQHWNYSYLKSTLTYLKDLNKPLVILGIRPRFTTSVPLLMDSNPDNLSNLTLNKYAAYDYKEKERIVHKVLKEINSTAFYVDMMKYFCPSGICKPLTENGEMAYLDSAHISAKMALHVGKSINKDIGKEIRNYLGKDFN